MDLPSNTFAILTFISAPAVLTNASCVLLFGTGNRYGRAIDRVHTLAETVEKRMDIDEAELRLRMRQLEAAESRTLLIVRALTCFYASVASFVASTLVSLIGAILVSIQGVSIDGGSVEARPFVVLSFALAFLAGTIGVVAMTTGAILLVRETRSSFRILLDETRFITQKVFDRVGRAG